MNAQLPSTLSFGVRPRGPLLHRHWRGTGPADFGGAVKIRHLIVILAVLVL
jgi:hypothetical protein